MTCIICEIIQKSLPSKIIFENEDWIAFLDKKPVFKGHCLLVPKIHFDTLLELPDKLGLSLLHHIKVLGRAIKVGLNAQGLFIANNTTISQSIMHTHIHLIPRNKGDGLKGFFWPRQQYDSEIELNDVQARIIENLKD